MLKTKPTHGGANVVTDVFLPKVTLLHAICTVVNLGPQPVCVPRKEQLVLINTGKWHSDSGLQNTVCVIGTSAD